MKTVIAKKYCLSYQVDKLEGTGLEMYFDIPFKGVVKLQLKKDKEVVLVLDVNGVEIDHE